MTIKAITLHLLKKNPSADYALVKRESPMDCDEKTTSLLSALISEYNHKQGKLFGLFSQELSQDGKFEQELKSYLQEQKQFTDFTIHAATDFKNRLAAADFNLEGYLVFIHYEIDSQDYLLISLLKPIHSIGVNQALELTDQEYLDINRLHLACRINLYDYQRKQNSHCVSWLQPATGRKLTDCFCDWIGVEATVNPKGDTKQLVQAFNEYCDTQVDNDKRLETKQKAYEYCQAVDEQGVSIKELSAHLSEETPDEFARFVNTRDYDMGETIIPAKSQLRAMIKYSGKAQGLAISFDAALLNSAITYDKENDCLVIKEIPSALKQQLQRNG